MKINLIPFFAIATTYFLVGCVSPVPDISIPVQKQMINVSEISISNLSTPTEKNESGSWTEGFIRLADSNTNPPFTILVIDALKQNLKPAGSTNAEILDVMMLRADLLMEMRTADSIVFINLASVLSDREYACRVEINFKQGSVNERKLFEGKSTHNRVWYDMDTAKKKEIVNSCLEKIVKEVANFANTFVKNNQKK